jgi:hypothetical protein
MIRNAAAMIAGIVTAFLTVTLIDKLNDMVYPPPAGLDFSDPTVIEPYLATLPIGAFVFILAWSVVAAFVGTLVACYIGTIKPLNCAIVVGGIVFAATVEKFIAIPHPLWLSTATLVGVVASAWFAMRLATPSQAKERDESEVA